MTIIQNEYARGAIVFDVDYRTGSIADRSPYKAAATVVGTPSWANTKRGYGLYTAGNSRMTYADNASNRLAASNATIIVLGRLNLSNLNGRIVSKRDTGGTCYDIFVNGTTAGTISFYDGTNTRTLAGRAGICDFLAITLVNGAAPLLYIDGSYVSTGSGATTIGSAEVPLYVGSVFTAAGTLPLKSPINRVTLLNRALSAAEISQLYQELSAERYPLRAYSFGCRISAPKDPPGCPSLLKTDFTTRLADGRLADLSGNGWHGTVKPGFVAAPGMCGNSLVATSASRTYVDFGEVPINGVSKLTIVHYGQRGASNPAELIFDKGTAAGNRNDISQSTTNITWNVGNGHFAAITDANVNTPLFQSWSYNGDAAVNGDKCKVNLDGAKPTVTITANFPTTLPSTAGTPFTFGRLGWLSNFPPPKQSDFLGVYLGDLTHEQTEYIRRQIARRSTFALDMQRVPVSLANLVGPCEVPGTPFRVNNGTWKVSEDTAGKHWFESVATNSSSIYMPSTQAFGTWVFEVYHTSASEYVFFTCSSPSIATGKTGYSVNLGGTALSLNRYDAGGPTTLFSASNAIAVGNKYTLAVTRSSPSEFTLLMIVGGKWTKVAATSGANPVTDATYKTSSFFTCAIFTAANAGKFGNVRMFAGPLTLDQLQEACP